MHNKIISYRPDIDGLRAIAVLAVVVFHFNKAWLPGGFIGVDIFFVISGYLITGIISKQLDSSDFSFVDFYARRAKRILPAALFVTLFTVVFGAMFMLPPDAEDVAKSGLASILSAANIYFWAFIDTDYFAPSSDLQPLLHMWSLGVEEQFYLIWPALLFISYKIGGKRMAMVAAIFISAASFIIAEYHLTKDAKFSYYMLPARAGELLLGALLFMAASANKLRSVPKFVSELSGVLGLIVVSWALVSIREDEGFPGLISIVPVIGTCLIIFSGQSAQSTVSRLLSLKPLAAIGLVSFSLYLWHWPVLSFYRYAYGEPVTVGAIAFCAGTMAIACVLSYQLIEQRYRHQAAMRKAVIALASTAVASTTAALAVIATGGYIWHSDSYKSAIHELSNNTAPAHEFEYNCQLARFNSKEIRNERCILGNKEKAPDTLLIGDSNAAHYVGFLKAVAESRNSSIRNLTHSACIPFNMTSSQYVAARRIGSCNRYNNQIWKHVENYKTVFISAAWASYIKTDDFYADFESQITALSQSVDNVIIGLQAPIFPDYDRQCWAKAIKIPLLQCQERARYLSKSDTRTNIRIAEIASKFDNVSVFSVRELVCPDGICSAFLDNQPLYFDRGHLSMAGSYKLGTLAVQRQAPEVALMSKR